MANSSFTTAFLPSVPKNSRMVHSSGAGTTQVQAGQGILYSVTVGTSVTGTVTLYDSLVGSGTVIAVLTLAAGQPFTMYFGAMFQNGLTAVAVGAQDVTFVVQ